MTGNLGMDQELAPTLSELCKNLNFVATFVVSMDFLLTTSL